VNGGAGEALRAGGGEAGWFLTQWREDAKGAQTGSQMELIQRFSRKKTQRSQLDSVASGRL